MTDQAPPDDGFGFAGPIVEVWGRQSETTGFLSLPADPDVLTKALNKAHRKDHLRMVRLNIQEAGASLFAAALFGWSATDAEHPLAALTAAALLVALSCFLVGSSVRHYRADRRWDASVRDQLARRLAQLDHRAWMYRNLAWWYFMPIFLSLALSYYASGGDFVSREALGIFSGYFAFCAVLYRINRRHGRIRYESEIDRLKPLLADFD